MDTNGHYAMLSVKGFFIKDLSCCTDGTKKISMCRSGFLGDLLREEKN